MKKITNPNFIYIAVFIVPFLVYTLHWSTIFPDLTIQLFTFYLITFLSAFIAGVVIDRLPRFVYNSIPDFRYNILIIILLYTFYLVDCLYMGFIPLFVFTKGAASYGGSTNFGIPTVHIMVVTFSEFFSLYLFHQYLSNRKLKLLLLYLLSFVPFIFLLQRSSIMYIIIGSAFMYFVSQKKLAIKRLLFLIVFAAGAIYLFGYLGNLRSSNGDPTFIPRASGATDEFLTSSVPKEFYWGYLYIGSPVANLQNNINIETNVAPDYKAFAVFEMMPDFITKKLADLFSVTGREFHQINAFLNVGSIYARPFSYLSWKGMYIIFFYLMGLMNLYYLIIRRSYIFGATGISLMFTMIALATFENTLWFSQYSFPLFYPFIFSILRGLMFRKKKTFNLAGVSIV